MVMKAYVGIALAAVLLLVVPAFGQTGTRLEGEIPFAFEMTGTVLPAGTYEVTLRMPILVRNADRSNYAAMTVSAPWGFPTGSDPVVKLVFNKYGDRHFLSQVWGPNSYYELPKSRQERELVTSRLIAGLEKPETVVLLARLVK
jgi:hypothetical protein